MQMVLATHNNGKLAELRAILATFPIELIAQSSLNVPDVEETGLTFIENAILKARHASVHTELPAIADDSGLMVDALNGAPGIYSARYAGNDATSADNITKLLINLQGVPDEKRTAHFYCVIAFMRDANDPAPLICTGKWSGYILHQPTGNKGFGYDPIFYVPEQQCSAAELSPPIKNKISHRGIALHSLIEQLAKQL